MNYSAWSQKWGYGRKMKQWSHKYKIGSKVQIKCGDYEAKAIVVEHVVGLVYEVEIYEGIPTDSSFSEVFLKELKED